MITAILLAAGRSERFGSPKLLARLPDGRRVIEASVANLRAANTRVIAVTRADDELVRVLAGCGCEVVVNSRAEQGMGTSIAAGVLAASEAAGWLITLGDMPYIQPATIFRIGDALERKEGIVVPVWKGRAGHPVGFPHSLLDELVQLSGDSGARSIILRHTRYELAVDDEGTTVDIDLPTDLR